MSNSQVNLNTAPNGGTNKLWGQARGAAAQRAANGQTFTNTASVTQQATKASKSLHNYKVGRTLVRLSNKADVFLKASSGAILTQGQTARAGFLTKNANHWSLKWFGSTANKVNNAGVSLANSTGKKLSEVLAKTTPTAIASGAKPGLIASAIAKVPGIDKLASGLSLVKKLPGLGVVISTGEAVWGVAKAVKLGLWDGDWNGAVHQVVKSGVTLGANLAGMALVAGGVVAAPFTAGASLAATAGGIAVLVGSDIAGRYAGEKLADFIAGPVYENGHSKGYTLEQHYQNRSIASTATEVDSEFVNHPQVRATESIDYSNDAAAFNNLLAEAQKAAFR